MRTSGMLLFAGLLGMAWAEDKRTAQQRTSPKTMWERKAREAEAAGATQPNLFSGLSFTAADALENVNKMVTGQLGFGDIVRSLQDQALSNPEPGSMTGDNINNIFSTFKFLQQSPAYKDAAGKWDTLEEAAKISVFTDSLKQMTNLVSNMDLAMKNNKDSHTMDDMVVDLMNSEDEEIATLKANLAAGTDPINTAEALQQKFVDKNFPGINIQALKDDEMIANKQQWFAQDPDLLDLVGDSTTTDMLLDPGLRFAEFAKAGMAAIQQSRE